MRWPLRRKLFFAFGSLIMLVAALGAVTYERLISLETLEERRSHLQETALAAEAMRSTLLQSRRHEKDFFLRGGDEEYEKLQQRRYVEFDALVALVGSHLADGDAALKAQVAETAAKHTTYRDAFASAAKAFQRAGTHESGLQAEFRQAAHEIESVAERLTDDRLAVLLLQVRRAEKDFLLRGEASYRDKLHTHGAALLEHTAKLSGKEGAEIGALYRAYQAKFDAAFEATQQLVADKQRLHDATEAIDGALEKLQGTSHETKKVVEAESAQVHAEARMLIVVMFLLTILAAAVVARVFSNQMSQAVTQLLGATTRIGDGDLRVRVNPTTSDELGELTLAFNKMAEALTTVSGGVKDAAGSLNGMVEELQSTVSEQGASLQQQASSVAETVATVEELSRSAGEVSSTANNVVTKAGASISTSEQGRNAIEQSIRGMNDVREQVQSIAATILELSEKTQQIGSIISTVDDFAEQSSLLALNASIEAARAGEEGKAFSVVAGEVKNLAEQSQRATERVRNILNDIQRTTHTAVMVTEEGSKRVDRGVELVGEAGRIIGTLTDSILEAAESAKLIAGAAAQQNAGIAQISVAMSGIDEFSKQNLDAIKQTETASRTLARVTGQLTSSTQRYVL